MLSYPSTDQPTAERRGSPAHSPGLRPLAAAFITGGLIACSASPAPPVRDAPGGEPVPAPVRGVLLVMLDDIGYEILPQTALIDPTDTCFSFPPTPTLRSLSERGVTFRNAYATPHCSPTRASLLTGRLPYRTGIGMIVDPCSTVHAGTEAELALGEVTLAEALRDATTQGLASNLVGASAGQIATAAVGKWHLGPDPLAPLQQGFDRFRGTISNIARCDRPDETLCAWWKNIDGALGMTSEYATTDSVDEALRFVNEHADEPWFLYLALHSGHAPFHAPPGHLAPDYFQDDGMGNAHHPALPGCEPPLPDCPVLGFPVEPCTPGCGLGIAHPDLDRSMALRPYYEAMVQATDTELGRLLASVDLEETLVIVVSDNGTPGEVVGPPLLGDRDAGLPSRAKGTLYEGGVRVPMIITGPGVRAANTSGELRTTDAMVQVADVFATVLEAVGVAPADIALVAPQDLDSRSFLDVLRGDTDIARTTLFSERFHPNSPSSLDPCVLSLSRAIRDDRYKLIDRPGPMGCNDPRVEELYDLETDPFEAVDLIASGAHLSPGRVRERYLALRAELASVPLP